jgi:hypothetical protein
MNKSVGLNDYIVLQADIGAVIWRGAAFDTRETIVNTLNLVFQRTVPYNILLSLEISISTNSRS